MSHATPSPESPSQKSLWVVGIAILLVFAEASWTKHQAGEGASAARHVVIPTDAKESDYVVYRAVNDHSVFFSLKAGDDCVYVDDADNVSRDGTTGGPLVPVFCPARGAGWTSLSLLTLGDPGRTRQ